MKTINTKTNQEVQMLRNLQILNNIEIKERLKNNYGFVMVVNASDRLKPLQQSESIRSHLEKNQFLLNINDICLIEDEEVDTKLVYIKIQRVGLGLNKVQLLNQDNKIYKEFNSSCNSDFMKWFENEYHNYAFSTKTNGYSHCAVSSKLIEVEKICHLFLK